MLVPKAVVFPKGEDVVPNKGFEPNDVLPVPLPRLKLLVPKGVPPVENILEALALLL